MHYHHQLCVGLHLCTAWWNGGLAASCDIVTARLSNSPWLQWDTSLWLQWDTIKVQTSCIPTAYRYAWACACACVVLGGYGVVLVSRIDKIIRLFCKRDPHKRRYCAKETCNFIDPTDCSHPIWGLPVWPRWTEIQAMKPLSVARALCPYWLPPSRCSAVVSCTSRACTSSRRAANVADSE